MNLKQISVFLENRPGHLSHVCKTLADAKLDIATLTLADTKEFGILRLILRDWQRAKEVLDAAGFAVNIIDVAAIEIADEPGGLEQILKVADENSLSVEYMYAFAETSTKTAVMVIRFGDTTRACEVMKDAGFGVLSASEFYAEN